MHTKRPLGIQTHLAAAAALALGFGFQSNASALLIADFEASSGYTAGSGLPGQMGWVGGNGTAAITPDLNSGYTFVIAGSQSAWANAGGTSIPNKTFAAAGATAADFYELSWLQAMPDPLSPTGRAGIWLYNPVTGGAAAGLFVETDAGKIVLHGKTILDSGYSAEMGGGGAPGLDQVYRFTMQFNFDLIAGTATMTGFMEDYTQLGVRTNLGTVALETGILPNPAYAVNNYGVGLAANGGVLAVDNIELNPIPEPAVSVLLGVGIAAVLLRRHRRTA